MTSPRLSFYAASTLTRQQAEAARADNAYWRIVDALPVCPCCQQKPTIDPSFYNQVCIYCDTDDCMGQEMQAIGLALKEAAQKWAERVTEWSEDHAA